MATTRDASPSTSGDAAALARGAVRHARWRWTGAPLLITGTLFFLWAIGSLSRGGSGWTVMLALFGTGLALASFGANHDSALALALRARAAPSAGLPDSLARELDEELDRDRAGTTALQPAPRIALILPLVAIAVQTYVAWRLLN